ncbi:MAG: efflux RND transporter permease subunit [Caulobacterales bacterium]
MLISDISVRRPVLAIVASLLIIVFGIVAFTQLPLRELPNVDQPVVTIQTLYRGASADIIDTRITKPIEDQLTGMEGLDLIRSQNRDGRSQITVEFKLTRNIEDAANDVRNAVARAQRQLPDDVDPPIVSKADADADPVMWLSLTSTTLNRLELSDYADRILLDRFSNLDGVAQATLLGGWVPSMRIWINPEALAARGLTIKDVNDALERENVDLPAGYVESSQRDYTVRVDRNYSTPEQFARLPIGRAQTGEDVRLGEVAKIERAPDERRRVVRSNGVDMVSINISRQSNANALDLAKAVRATVKELEPTLPQGVHLSIMYDGAVFVDKAVVEVYKTLAEAAILVIIVIYLFLGTMRAAFVPAAVIPVCLIGAFVVLALFGFSINLLTLLALVLSIGLVVDDSIVVLENVQRRVDEGEPRLIAAERGTRQVAFAVIATSLVLVTVFMPLLFVGGYVGKLFVELATTVASVVLISAFCALTLSPMMCSKLLRQVEPGSGNRVVRYVDKMFNKVRDSYTRSLDAALDRKALVVGGFVVTVLMGGLMLRGLPSELLPQEDRGGLFLNFTAPDGTGFDATLKSLEKTDPVFKELRDKGEIDFAVYALPGNNALGVNRFNAGVGRITLTDWDKRHRSAAEIGDDLNKRFAGATGGTFRFRQQGALPNTGGDDVSITLSGTEYDKIYPIAQRVLARAQDSKLFVRPRLDYEPTSPRVLAKIDLERAAAMGISAQTIGETLETLMGSSQLGTYVDRGEEYDVIIQADRAERSTIGDMSGINVRSDTTGQLSPLANFVTFENTAGASTLPRLNRLRAITVGAGLPSGVSIGAGLKQLETIAKEEIGTAPIMIDYQGASKQFKDSSGALLFTFGFALLIVYLTLAAQFESFVHPGVIMLTAPLAVAGGAFGLFLFDGTLNIYSQIGFIILIALAAKNGILIVEFANQLRDEGKSIRDSIREASELRLRPILMTSIATIAGALPLMLGHGAGGESRAAIGIVIVFGVGLATMLTLLVVPVVYDFVARYTKSPETVRREIEEFEAQEEQQRRAAE